MTAPSTPEQHQVRFSFARLEAWAPNVVTRDDWHEWGHGDRAIERLGEPALQQMPPMLRRHAGRLGRAALSPAYDTLGDLRDVPMVFSARYGEVSRSVDLLTALSAGEELSPTTFGLSVHNAVPGLFSMARKETANAISLAAGDDAAEFGVIEACGLVADGAEQVLLVVADCPLPEIYEKYEDTTPAAFGWSCLILPPTADVVTLKWSDTGAIVSEIGDVGSLTGLAVLLGEARAASRQSRAIGQNDCSDTKLSSLDPKLSSLDPNLSSLHPNLSSPGHTKSSPARRTWHWSRNA